MLIGGASLAGRRWGPAVGGWIVGLPLTSAPIAFFLARDHGLAFAAAAAVGIMAGTVSQAAFCVAYARTAMRAHWPLATLAGSIAFALATLALRWLPLSLVPLAALAVLSLLLSTRLMPALAAAPRAAAPLPWWDLPARMVVTTGFVVLLTGVASLLGPRLTGLVTPFPLYAAILVSFTQSLDASSLTPPSGPFASVRSHSMITLLPSAATTSTPARASITCTKNRCITPSARPTVAIGGRCPHAPSPSGSCA